MRVDSEERWPAGEEQDFWLREVGGRLQASQVSRERAFEEVLDTFTQTATRTVCCFLFYFILFFLLVYFSCCIYLGVS